MNFEQNNSDIWVFLSHSNKDYELVREVRNKMEEQGMRPLMFFLKCLDDEPEIFDLLKREIDVRPRFILCDSENAQASEWVQKEVEYIKSKNRQYLTIDLSKPETFAEKVSEMKRRSKVYIANSRKDDLIAAAIKSVLHKRGFIVYSWEDYEVDHYTSFSLQENLINNIVEICKEGYFIPILTENFCGEWLREELKIALEASPSSIIPFINNDENNPWTELFKKTDLKITNSNDNLQDSIEEFCEYLVQEDLKRNK